MVWVSLAPFAHLGDAAESHPNGLHKTGLILALLSAVASIYDPARKGLLGPGDGHALGAFHFGGLFLLQNPG